MSAVAAAVTLDAGFGVYIHWPYCLSKCPYCDFNSHVRQHIDEARWRAAILAELAHYAALAPAREVTSVFFGGGTPSLVSGETITALVAAVRSHWPVAADCEVTLEANPSSVEAGRFADYAAAGVNRLSLGVQSLEDVALRFLGRRHSAKEALAAVELARRHFPRTSFDLIYARPGQGVAAWRRELAQALEHAGRHLSLYQLTIEPGTPFADLEARGELELPPENEVAALYEATQEMMEAVGLPAYEISNHAVVGEEARHNLNYWRYGDYVGVGPGAHGRITIAGVKTATRQHRAPEGWLARVETEGHATRTETPLTRDECREEMVMLGLRLREGIARERFRALCGAEPEALFASSALARLGEGGFLELDERGLRASARGRQRLNAVLAMLLA